MNRTAIGCMAALTLIAGAHAQTFTVGVPLIDLSKSTQVIPFPFGGTLPTTGCVPNSFYNKTGGSAGLYLNSGTGTCSWALVTGGGGGGVTCAVAGGITCVGTQVAADPAIVTFNSATAGGLSSGTSAVHCSSSSGSGTTYTAACGIALTAYSTGQTLWWTCDTTSTGAATLNIETLGVRPLKKADGTAIDAGALTCPHQYPIWDDGTNFIVLTAGLASTVVHSFGGTFDGGGSALTAGKTVYFTVPYACTIQAWNIVVDTGTATVDFWKVATGTAIPTISNTITASAIPAISTGTAIHSTTLTGWTLPVAANDIFGVNLKVVSSATFVNAVIQCQ